VASLIALRGQGDAELRALAARQQDPASPDFETPPRKSVGIISLSIDICPTGPLERQATESGGSSGGGVTRQRAPRYQK
jgi:hypothetical protein